MFETIATLRQEGRTIVYISHILGDVKAISDDIAVLRDGRLVDHGAASDFPIPRMIKSMIGRDLGGQFPPRSNAPGAELILSARALCEPGVLENVSIDVREGEVLGLFGLMGAGRSELARILFGLDPHASGDILVNGEALAGGPRSRIAAGIAFVTENRREEGLMLDASIADNLALVSIDRFGRKPFALVDLDDLSSRDRSDEIGAVDQVGRYRDAIRENPFRRQSAESRHRQMADAVAEAVHS